MITDKEDQEDIRAIFRDTVKGSNFLTPNVVYYDRSGEFIVELSSGRGLTLGVTVYGVTVLTSEGERTDDLSTVFLDGTTEQNKVAAEQYIFSLSSTE